MLDKIYYTCTAMPVNKKGILKKDSDGYYEVVLGALNAYSNAGDYYVLQGAKELFDESSHFIRRIAQGTLYGENGHPYPLPNEKFQDFARRCAVVNEKNVSHHFKKIWLEYDKLRDGAGRPIVAIVGLIKPHGPYGQMVEDGVNNPNINTCFSIRSFTDDQQIGGTLHRTLTDIITFDHVLESGIQQARKYSSPTLESLQAVPMTKNDLRQAMLSNNGVMAMESSNRFYAEMFQRKGWSISGDNKPGILSWK